MENLLHFFCQYRRKTGHRKICCFPHCPITGRFSRARCFAMEQILPDIVTIHPGVLVRIICRFIRQLSHFPRLRTPDIPADAFRRSAEGISVRCQIRRQTVPGHIRGAETHTNRPLSAKAICYAYYDTFCHLLLFAFSYGRYHISRKCVYLGERHKNVPFSSQRIPAIKQPGCALAQAIIVSHGIAAVI